MNIRPRLEQYRRGDIVFVRGGNYEIWPALIKSIRGNRSRVIYIGESQYSYISIRDIIPFNQNNIHKYRKLGFNKLNHAIQMALDIQAEQSDYVSDILMEPVDKMKTIQNKIERKNQIKQLQFKQYCNEQERQQGQKIQIYEEKVQENKVHQEISKQQTHKLEHNLQQKQIKQQLYNLPMDKVDEQSEEGRRMEILQRIDRLEQKQRIRMERQRKNEKKNQKKKKTKTKRKKKNNQQKYQEQIYNINESINETNKRTKSQTSKSDKNDRKKNRQRRKQVERIELEQNEESIDQQSRKRNNRQRYQFETNKDHQSYYSKYIEYINAFDIFSTKIIHKMVIILQIKIMRQELGWSAISMEMTKLMKKIQDKVKMFIMNFKGDIQIYAHNLNMREQLDKLQISVKRLWKY